MTTINNIFTVTKKGTNIFECVNQKYNLSQLRFIKSSTTQIYIHNDLELHVDKNNNKQYHKITNDDHQIINDTFIIQKITVSQINSTQFPLLKTYNDIITRKIDTYYDNKTNININIINDTNHQKELNTYIQIIGDYPFENIMKFIKICL